MNYVLFSCVVFVVSSLNFAHVHAASLGKPTSNTPSNAQASKQAVKNTSKTRRQISRSKAVMTQSREAVRQLEAQIMLAKNGEQSVRRRYTGQTGSQARNAIRSATLERANLENRLNDAVQRYQSARTAYQQATAQLRAERRLHWQNQTSRSTARKPQPKARKLTFAKQPLGPTGSGAVRPNQAAKGVLKTTRW